MKDFLLAEYKQLKKKYIIEKEEFNEKVADQKAKNKEAKKLEKTVIKEVPEGEEGAEGEEAPPPEKNKNELRQELMKKLEN